jgi:hypothetical protein
MIPPIPIIVQNVPKQQLRDVWNDPEFQAEIQRMTTQRVEVSANLAPPEANQEEGTMSCVYDLMNNPNSQLLATYHVYKRRDGTIGASGREDPIFLLVDGVPHVDP